MNKNTAKFLAASAIVGTASILRSSEQVAKPFITWVIEPVVCTLVSREEVVFYDSNGITTLGGENTGVYEFRGIPFNVGDFTRGCDGLGRMEIQFVDQNGPYNPGVQGHTAIVIFYK